MALNSTEANLEQLKQFPEIHSAYQTFVETKKLQPANATQLVKFCKSQNIPDVKYSQASKYFRIKQGLASDSLSQHSKPSKMYSKYYASKKKTLPQRPASTRASNSTGQLYGTRNWTNKENNSSNRRESEPYDGNISTQVNLENLITDYNNSQRRDSQDLSDGSPATPLSPQMEALTKQEKLEIKSFKNRFDKESSKQRLEAIYLRMAANATDEQVVEVFDDLDAQDAAAIETIQANIEAAFKALVNSMKSHGVRLTQSNEQLQVIDTQFQAAKELIVKEFDIAMGTMLKRRNGLLKALEVAHEEHTKTLKEQAKEQQNASNKLLQCKDHCRECVKNKQTKEAIEAVVNVLNEVRPTKPELATVNIAYKQSDPKLHDFLESYGTLSIAKTMRTKKKKDESAATDDNKADN